MDGEITGVVVCGLDDMTDGDDDQEQSRDNEEKESRSVINKRWSDRL